MARKPKGLQRVRNHGPKFPKWAKLDEKAFSGPLGGELYGWSVEKLGKFHYPVFRSKFAARKYLDLLIKDDEVTWISDTELVTSRDLWMRGDELKEYFDYQYKGDRVKVWDLPDQYKRKANYMRSNKSHTPPPPQKYKKRISRKGMILIGDICKKIGMNPRDARGILRALGYDKPEHGWAWRERKDADEIKQTLLQSRRKTHVSE